jgi:hypothetical protein
MFGQFLSHKIGQNQNGPVGGETQENVSNKVSRDIVYGTSKDGSDGNILSHSGYDITTDPDGWHEGSHGGGDRNDLSIPDWVVTHLLNNGVKNRE